MRFPPRCGCQPVRPPESTGECVGVRVTGPLSDGGKIKPGADQKPPRLGHAPLSDPLTRGQSGAQAHRGGKVGGVALDGAGDILRRDRPRIAAFDELEGGAEQGVGKGGVVMTVRTIIEATYVQQHQVEMGLHGVAVAAWAVLQFLRHQPKSF